MQGNDFINLLYITRVTAALCLLCFFDASRLNVTNFTFQNYNLLSEYGPLSPKCSEIFIQPFIWAFMGCLNKLAGNSGNVSFTFVFTVNL